MDEGEFIFAMMIGAMMGMAITLLIQWYGRRKIKNALKAEAISPGRQNELLITENEAMRGQMLRLEERLSVMERITTDSHMSLNQEFERLR
jgi:hypothetical protein